MSYERLNTVYGIFGVHTKPMGHLWHLKIDVTKPGEPSSMLKPNLGKGADRGHIQSTWGFVWEVLIEFLTALSFNSGE